MFFAHMVLTCVRDMAMNLWPKYQALTHAILDQCSTVRCLRETFTRGKLEGKIDRNF